MDTMDKKFDFNQIGKRMPYSTPDNFFDKLETEVKTSLPNKSKHQKIDGTGGADPGQGVYS